MQHLEDGYLHEIADGEVPSEELVSVREHLDGCESCRARLDQARMEAETARELVELIDVPELALHDAVLSRAVGEAPEPMFAASLSAPLAGRMSFEQVAPVATESSRTGGRWIRRLAWAASLVLAAGIGYMTRSENEAALSSRIDPLSIGRIDTVYVSFPAQTAPPEANESDAVSRDALNRRQVAGAPPAEPPRSERAAPQRAEEEQSSKRRADEVVATKAAEKKEAPKDADAKLQEGFRAREANDTRDQPKQLRSTPPQPASPSVAGATAESRLMAKSAADEAPTIISFPRAVELLGGRIKLIEGMVPVRLEALGRTVRVIYVIDEGNLVLAQVAATDSLHWNLSGPLSVDSLQELRLRVR